MHRYESTTCQMPTNQMAKKALYSHLHIFQYALQAWGVICITPPTPTAPIAWFLNQISKSYRSVTDRGNFTVFVYIHLVWGFRFQKHFHKMKGRVSLYLYKGNGKLLYILKSPLLKGDRNQRRRVGGFLTTCTHTHTHIYTTALRNNFPRFACWEDSVFSGFQNQFLRLLI